MSLIYSVIGGSEIELGVNPTKFEDVNSLRLFLSEESAQKYRKFLISEDGYDYALVSSHSPN